MKRSSRLLLFCSSIHTPLIHCIWRSYSPRPDCLCACYICSLFIVIVVGVDLLMAIFLKSNVVYLSLAFFLLPCIGNTPEKLFYPSLSFSCLYMWKKTENKRFGNNFCSHCSFLVLLNLNEKPRQSNLFWKLTLSLSFLFARCHIVRFDSVSLLLCIHINMLSCFFKEYSIRAVLFLYIHMHKDNKDNTLSLLLSGSVLTNEYYRGDATFQCQALHKGQLNGNAEL